MTPPINWAKIYGRAKAPQEPEPEGGCPNVPPCGDALIDHIRGVCIAFLLHNVPDCGCGMAAHSSGPAGQMELEL